MSIGAKSAGVNFLAVASDEERGNHVPSSW